MGRLTEKINDSYIDIGLNQGSMCKCVEKLGKLEDIEQELRITLEVLFKALKDGIYYINNLNEIEFMYNPKLFYAEHLNCYRFREGTFLIEDIVNIKDYGKTWALTREKLENAED